MAKEPPASPPRTQEHRRRRPREPFNNTMITITDAQGNTIPGRRPADGLQGLAQVDALCAAQMAAEDAAQKAAEHGMRTLESKCPVRVRAANRRCARCRRRASPSPRSAT